MCIYLESSLSIFSILVCIPSIKFTATRLFIVPDTVGLWNSWIRKSIKSIFS